MARTVNVGASHEERRSIAKSIPSRGPIGRAAVQTAVTLAAN
jgi:hypothetical protein